MITSRHFASTGAFLGALAIAAGAFGAHALKGTLTSESIAVFETGVRYQMYHALGLFLVAWLCRSYPQAKPEFSGWLFIAGILLFSGSLYVLSITGVRWLGAVTPFGGICFVAGWIWLGYTLLRQKDHGSGDA